MLLAAPIAAFAEDVPIAMLSGNSGNKTLTFTCGDRSSIDNTTVLDVATTDKDHGWVQNAEIRKVVFVPSFANARPKSTKRWFFYLTNLETIQGIEYLNTSEVTDMNNMFRFCQSLAQLDLSHFDTHKVTSMYSMFEGCYKLKFINLKRFNTEKVTDMENMFRSCWSLETLDISNFSFASKPNVKWFAQQCLSLTNLIVGNNDLKDIPGGNYKQYLFSETGTSGNPLKLTVFESFDTSVLGEKGADGTYSWYEGAFTLNVTMGTNSIATPAK